MDILFKGILGTSIFQYDSFPWAFYDQSLTFVRELVKFIIQITYAYIMLSHFQVHLMSYWKEKTSEAPF